MTLQTQVVYYMKLVSLLTKFICLQHTARLKLAISWQAAAVQLAEYGFTQAFESKNAVKLQQFIRNSAPHHVQEA